MLSDQGTALEIHYKGGVVRVNGVEASFGVLDASTPLMVHHFNPGWFLMFT